MAKTQHARTWLTASIVAALTLAPASTVAQKYPQTVDGSTVYYKLLSACPLYAGQELCLEDKSRTDNTYPYRLTALDPTARLQEWVLVSVSKEQETYHLRNRGSYRYISTESTWVGNFKVLGFATRPIESNALTITDLGDDQVAISYEDTYGKRYLSATDVSQAQADMPTSLKDTQWAWKIYRADDLASGIHEACTPAVRVWVEGQRIQVSGADTWEVTDVAGIRIPATQPVQRGHVYLVRARGTITKIIAE